MFPHYWLWRRYININCTTFNFAVCQDDHHSYNPGLQPWKLSTCDHQRTTKFSGNRWVGQTFYGNQHDYLGYERLGDYCSGYVVIEQLNQSHGGSGGDFGIGVVDNWLFHGLSSHFLWSGDFSIGRPQKIKMLSHIALYTKQNASETRRLKNMS